jgi:alkenylglycerophosphocholine hydrolase
VALYLVGLWLPAPALGLVVKPVPALALAALVLRRGEGFRARAVGAGLVLSALGDVLLDLPRQFTSGLTAFLLAHLAYSAAFLEDERRPRLLRAVPFALWLGSASLFVWPQVRAVGLALPVTVYMAAIGTMMWRAAARVDPGRAGAVSGLVGALLFGLSDTLIALDRFHAPVPGVRYAIILLYWAGQAGIAASVPGPPSRPRPDSA